MATKFSNNSFISRMGNKKLNHSALRVMLVMLCLLTLGVGNAWGSSPGSGTHYISATTAAPGQGLVYMSKSNETNVADDKFKNSYPGGLLVGNKDLTGDAANNANACYTSNGNNGCTPTNMFFWARPSRGYEFNGSWGTRGTNYAAHPSSKGAIGNACNTEDELNQGPWDGTDIIQTTAGGSAQTYMRPIAGFKQATKYVITYVVPNGGSYSVHYEYIKSYDTGDTEADGTAIWKFRTETEDYSLTPSLEENKLVDSYAADEITLTVPAETTNFIGWYENDVLISGSETKKTLTYTAHADVTIEPKFKDLAWGDVSGDVTTNASATGTFGGKTVYVAIPTMIGTWTAADFTVTPMNTSNSFGSIAIGTMSLNTSVNPSRLEIPYTYTATGWGGVDANITITPAYGATKQFPIACSAEEVVDYEACIEESDVRTYTGTLAAMMTQANTMTNKPTVKLMNPVTITAPLSFTKSMTFDVNGKVLTASCASAFSIDAASIDVKIIDGSFTQVGEIHTSYASASAVSVVTFTQAAKLTMQGGTLSVENTGAGAAYGVDVQQGSVFYMTNGDLTVTASTGNAQGVHVATASDYATLNGGSISVIAPTNAYGLWSAGQSNVENATIIVETAGADAYGVYVNGGVSTLNTPAIAATAATTNAYGAYVNAGRLNGNAGSIAASAATSGVFGVHVHGGATAMLQQNMVITAEATGASGTSVFGVDNLGTVGLTNVSVTATSPTTAATAVNSATSAVSTTIDGGTYRATAEGGTAYGLHHQYGALTVDGGTFRAIGSGNNVYGARAVADGSIANASITGETRGTGNTAYGFVGGVANKNITLTNCAITGQSNTSKAYAIYSRANVTATSCTLTATTLGANYACGFYAENGANSSVNTNASVSSYTTQAYGVYHAAGSMTVNGGEYNVEAKQTTAASAQNSELYGLYNAASQTTNVNGTSFIVNAENQANAQNVYGAYINGTLNSSDATYYVEAKLNVYGVWGNTASTLNLSDNTISSSATNGTTSYGVYAKKNFTIDGDIVNATGTSTGVYAMFFDATNSVGEVRGGKFSAVGNGTTNYGPLNSEGTVGKVQLKGGVYTTNANLSKYAATGYNVYNLDETLSDYAGGYRHTIATENPSPYVCKIVGGNYYTTLEAALQYTKDNDGTYTIVMTQNYTLPAGDYELPEKATLLIPHKEGQQTIYGTGSDNSNKTTIAGVVEEFMRLTLASGANLNVNGKIEASAQMYCVETGHISFINGPYARIYMASGSLIQLNSGAVLYAWGKVSGAGEIKVKNNAEVREMFQIYGMPSMSNLAQEYNDNSYKFFPVQQYEISNVEVPTTYYYNSRLVCAMSNYYKGALVGVGYNKDDNIKVVGTSNALFLVTSDDESAWVRKSYVGGYQVWEANSAAKLGSLTIDMQQASMNSANYILPLTTSMKIHILDGDFTITQDAQLLPGSQLEINKTGQLTINSGCRLFVFDADQSTFTSKPDAALNIHGKIDVKGGLYTSNKGSETSKTDGANIYSNNADAGTITFSTNAPSATTIKLMTSATATKTVNMESAKLKNGDDSYAETAGTASGEAWVYMNNEWVKTYTNGCFEVIGSTVYAKPSEYVALKKSQTVGGKLTGVEETNHTYLTVEDKILILMDECQWWEVEETTDPAVFECKKEGYEGFYAYNNSTSKWELKTVNVTFYMKETGTDTNDKTVSVGWQAIPDQAVIATNPTKETTAEYTYAFYGWKSSVTGNEYSWTAELEPATADMSYRPVFTATKRNYTITLNNANNGAAVPVEVPYGEVPSYTPKKDAVAQYTYTFEGWTPALQAVNGPATYTATWSSVVNRYTITWMDGETVLETDKNQAYGTATSFGGTTPTKEADNEYAYTFSGWKSSLTGTTYANGSTPAVAGATTYTAQYNTTPRYKITFANFDGTSLQPDYYVTQGTVPVYNGLTPGRTRDLDGYYKFVGWKNSVGTSYAPDATLPAATTKETYTAQYEYVTELYTITLNNVDGAGATWSGKFGVGSMPFYNRDNNDVAVEPTKTSTAQYDYPFTGWTPAMVAVSGEATYTAQFGQETRKYEITFANLDGNGAEQTIEVEYGTTPESPVTPEKVIDHTTYAFTGWNPAIASVSGDAIYTAQFSNTGEKQKFAITFDPENGSDPQVSQVEYGTTPAWSGETPTKDADVQYTYTFAGWYPALGPVTGDETYSAQYTQTLNTYTVTFKNYDGTVLESKEWQYGTTPSYSGTTPEKPADVANKNVYTFDGWSSTNGGAKLGTLPAVNGEATYYAHYSEATFVAIVTPESGTPYYATSWADAYNHISDGCTLKLYADATPDENTAINKNMTLDLNGYTLSKSTSSTSNTQLFNVSKALTIMDSGDGGKITYTGSSRYGYKTIYVNGSTASLIINSGSIQATNTRTSSTNNGSTAANAVEVASSATLTINGGELIATSTKGNARAVNNNNTNITITGGKLKVTGNATLNIFNSSNVAKVTASGGYYSKDPNGITIATGHAIHQIDDATDDPEYSNGYTYKVVATHTVTFNANGHGIAPESQTNVHHGYKATEPTAPVETGYTFGGWYKEQTCTNQWNFASDVVTENLTLYAKWEPRTDINYTVKHYQQNIADDDYTEVTDDQETKQGTTATATAATAKTYTGFTAQPISQETIAGDGSTVVSVYYNRNTYTVTWKNEDETVLESDENVRYGDTPAYNGTTPTKAQDADYTYTFVGWTTEADGSGTFYEAGATPTVSGDATYYAHFAGQFRGTVIDIIDWTFGTGDKADKAATVTLNMNGYSSRKAPWHIGVSGTDIDKVASNRSNTDRSLTLNISSLNLTSGSTLTIIGKDADLATEHTYTFRVPYVYTSNTTLTTSPDGEDNTIFVHDGATLTIDGEVEVSSVYVNPQAKLVITKNRQLTVLKRLVMRTTAWQAAELLDNGTLSFGSPATGQMYYTRQISDKTSYYQFSLPYASRIEDVFSSNSKSTPYGNWILKRYNGASRAEHGEEGPEGQGNWVSLSSTDDIQPYTGYEIWSNSAYYRELFFPVTYAKHSIDDDIEVAVLPHTGAAATQNIANAGWNYISTPFTFTYMVEDAPPTVTISELTEDNHTYWQHVVDPSHPLPTARPFLYQARTTAGTLTFGETITFESSVPSSVAAHRNATGNAHTSLQWIRLTAKAIETQLSDETNILISSRYTAAYELGCDVQKMLSNGNRPQVYTSLACGMLTTTAVPDDITAIPLGLYTPEAGLYTLTVDANRWQDRIDHVWLLDTESGTTHDLLFSPYQYAAERKMTTSRFVLMPVMKAESSTESGNGSEVTTDVEDSGNTDIHVNINGGQISVSGLTAGMPVILYDATGRLIAKHDVQQSREVSINVSAAGVYLLRYGNDTRRVVIGK